MIREKSFFIGVSIMDSEFLADKDMIQTFIWFPRWKSVEISTAPQSCIFCYHMQDMCVEIPSEDDGIFGSTDNTDYFLYLFIPDDRTETQMDDKEMNFLSIDIHDTLP